MNRNLSPQEFADIYVDLSPGAGQAFEFGADIEARKAAGLPGHYEGIAGAANERRSVESMPPLPGLEEALFTGEWPDTSEEDRRIDREWNPPPGRMN